MIFILMIIMGFIAFYSYKNTKLRLLSPSFWCSFMFFGMSFFYCITFFDMNSDISPLTLLVIILFVMGTMLAEYIGTYVKFNEKAVFKNMSNNIELTGPVYIAKWKIYILTGVFLYVAYDRYRHLLVIARSFAGVGEFGGIISLLTSARRAFVAKNRGIVLGNTITNQLVYISEITTYVCIYVFLYNLVIHKKKNFYLLLPLIPDLALRLLTTSRTSFIMLFFAFGICYVSVLFKKSSTRRIRIPKWLYVSLAVFFVAFMAYGRARNEVQEIPIISYVQMYTCASIYGLNHLIISGWESGPYFGFYSMQEIYRLLGINHVEIPSFQRNVVFNRFGETSNLYTSLNIPIMDFGILGALLLRFIAGIIATKVVLLFFYMPESNKKKYILLYFTITLLYCYMYSATGDVFRDYYFHPSLMIRYFVYGIVLIYLFLRPKVINELQRVIR